MIAMLTSAAWPSVQIELDNGVDPAQTWTPTAGVSDIYSAAEDFVAWIDATFPGESASWSWSQSGDAPDVTITTQATYIWTANSAAQTVLGCDASTSDSNLLCVAPSGAITMQNTPAGGSLFAVVVQQPARAGVSLPAAAEGAVGGVPGRSAVQVALSWAGNRGMLEYQRASLAAAQHPRRAYVYAAPFGAWGLLEFGAVDIRSIGTAYISRCEALVAV